MNLSELDEGARQAMLLRIREDPSCASALKRLQGEVLLIHIVGLAEYRLAFREGSVTLDPEAKPSLKVEGKPVVMDAILEGRLDPLVAILTRRLKARIDPVRGPLLRQILCSGLGRTASDMGWDRVIGKLHYDPEPPAVSETAAAAPAEAPSPAASEQRNGDRGAGAPRSAAAPEFASGASAPGPGDRGAGGPGSVAAPEFASGAAAPGPGDRGAGAPRLIAAPEFTSGAANEGTHGA